MIYLKVHSFSLKVHFKLIRFFIFLPRRFSSERLRDGRTANVINRNVNSQYIINLIKWLFSKITWIKKIIPCFAFVLIAHFHRCISYNDNRWICIEVHLHFVSSSFGSITRYGHFTRLNDGYCIRCNWNGYRTGKMQTPANSIRHKQKFVKKTNAWIL